MSRLQALHILCAILNLTRGIYIDKRTMTQVKKYNHLDDAQYGGQKGRDAIEPAVIKILTVEICYLQRSNTAFADCDAKVCYNRIIPAVSAILETKAGCPEKVSTLLARTLKELEYHPTTAKGYQNSTVSTQTKVQDMEWDKAQRTPQESGP
eukprot:15362266-Ditylum_brightwellii.AAC.1